MGIFDKLKKETTLQVKKQEEQNKNIYAELGIIEPFTLLVDGQFNSFIAELANNSLGILNEKEKKAFEVLWNVAGIDYDGYGNNIWNLKEGNFEVYKNEDVVLSFEKKKSEVRDKYGSNEGRANFVYLSNDGNFIIVQSDRNKKAFLVYVSENASERLLQALYSAESEALKIEKENNISSSRVGIPKSFSMPSISSETSKNDENELSEPIRRR